MHSPSSGSHAGSNTQQVSPAAYTSRYSVRPDIRLEQVLRAERAAMARTPEPIRCLAPLVLALARMAAADDVSAECVSQD